MKRRLSGERGIAMVAVMGVMLVTSILAFAVAATAQRTNVSSIKDSNSTRALAAAETGLNVGRFNVGKWFGNAPESHQNDDRCFWGVNDPGTTVPDTPLWPAAPASTCLRSEPQQVGNGATYRYTVSRVLRTPSELATCVAPAGPVTPATSRRRCVTAVGEMNGTRRQLQTLIVENRGAPIFPFPGMLGLDRVELNASDAVGSVGTNGTLSLTGTGSDIRDPGTINLGGNNWSVLPSNYGVPNRQISPQPFVLDYHDEWYSESVRAPTAGTNRIASVAAAPGVTVTGTRQVDASPGSVVILESGADYNFCSLRMNSAARFVVPPTATEPVRVFIDSSHRPSGTPNYVPSGCPALTGNVLDLRSGSGFDNLTGKSSMLQLYVYGGPNQDIVFNASAAFTGTLFAPQSRAVFNSGATVTGAIAAKEIEFRNNGGNAGFTGDPDAGSVVGRWEGAYKRNGWRECRPSGPC